MTKKRKLPSDNDVRTCTKLDDSSTPRKRVDTTTTSSLPPPPPYGSKEYWEERYRNQLRLLQKDSSYDGNSNDGDEKKEKIRGSSDVAAATADNGNDGVEKDDVVGDVPTKDGRDNHLTTTSPYHSWYFTYDELRPILLPLILGGRKEARDIIARHSEGNDDTDEEEEQDDDEEGEGDAVEIGDDRGQRSDSANIGDMRVDKHPEQMIKNDNEPTVDNDGSDDDNEKGDGEEEEVVDDDENDDGYEEVVEGEETEEEDEEEDPLEEREGLAKDKPIRILEVGCGDVPLGGGLALELYELQQAYRQQEEGGGGGGALTDHRGGNIPNQNDVQTPTTMAPAARRIVSQILCTDYSQVVIDMMRKQYITARTAAEAASSIDTKSDPKESFSVLKQIHVGDIPLEFETSDARHLPYEDGSYHLVLEKGTLDAMLSDKEHGLQNCIQIVSECARVLTLPGYMVIISHLNAHTRKGIGFLQEIVFAGLSKEQQRNREDLDYTWEIEVHGNDQVVDDDEDDESDNDDDDDDEKSGQRRDSGRGPVGSAGPAVYVIHKKKRTINNKIEGDDTKQQQQQQQQQPEEEKDELQNGKGDGRSMPTIPVKFFAY